MKKIYLIMAVLSVIISGIAHAKPKEGDTIAVPKDYPTIQEAIDAAENKDTVLVAPGTYVENIDFKEKAITVTSSEGASVTAIDGNDIGSVVIIKNCPQPNPIRLFPIAKMLGWPQIHHQSCRRAHRRWGQEMAHQTRIRPQTRR